jgi:hypothetical protein
MALVLIRLVYLFMVWVPKTCASWPDALLTVGCSARAASRGVGRSSACGVEAGLPGRLSCGIAAGVVAAESWWKDAEILMLRR